MDSATLKTVLASQDQAYKGALDACMKTVNDKLTSSDNTIKELVRSLEFTQGQVEDLRNQVNRLEQQKKDNEMTITKLNDELKLNKQATESLEARTNYQEDYNRRNNLQIVGLEEQTNESWEQTAVKVTKLLEEKMELLQVEVERAHRVGPRREERNRPVVVRFSKFSDREAVRRNAAKLRGTRIYVNEDLCQASQAIRKEKLPLLKQARREGKIAYFNHTKLVIKERATPMAGSADRAGPSAAAGSGVGGGVPGGSAAGAAVGGRAPAGGAAVGGPAVGCAAVGGAVADRAPASGAVAGGAPAGAVLVDDVAADGAAVGGVRVDGAAAAVGGVAVGDSAAGGVTTPLGASSAAGGRRVLAAEASGRSKEFATGKRSTRTTRK